MQQGHISATQSMECDTPAAVQQQQLLLQHEQQVLSRQLHLVVGGEPATKSAWASDIHSHERQGAVAPLPMVAPVGVMSVARHQSHPQVTTSPVGLVPILPSTVATTATVTLNPASLQVLQQQQVAFTAPVAQLPSALDTTQTGSLNMQLPGYSTGQPAAPIHGTFSAVTHAQPTFIAPPNFFPLNTTTANTTLVGDTVVQQPQRTSGERGEESPMVVIQQSPVASH